MIKNVLCALLAAAVALSTVGCGKKAKKDAAGTDGPAAVTTVPVGADEQTAVTGSTDEIGATDATDATDAADTTSPSATPSVTESTESEAVTDTVSKSPNSDPASPEPYREVFTDGSCTVTLVYPRFGDGAHDAFDEAVRENALKAYRTEMMMTDDVSVYEVTLMEVTFSSERLVSAVSAGRIMNADTGHDSYFSYTVNADPSSGKLYITDTLIGELGEIKSAMERGDFTQSYGMENVTDEINAVDITVGWREDYGIFPDMYFTDKTLGVLAELPAALGGFAGFEISRGSAGEMISDTAAALWRE